MTRKYDNDELRLIPAQCDPIFGNYSRYVAIYADDSNHQHVIIYKFGNLHSAADQHSNIISRIDINIETHSYTS